MDDPLRSVRYRVYRDGEHCPSNADARLLFERLSKAEAEAAKLRGLLDRAAWIAEHLMQMIDRETWRASGGDDGQGHYEGDYREAQTFEEIQSWKDAVRV